MKKRLLLLAFAAQAAAIGAAHAAVDSNITDMFTNFKTDALIIIGLATVTIAAVTGGWTLVQAAKKFLRGSK